MKHRAEKLLPQLVLMELGYSAQEAASMGEIERRIVFEASRQLAELRKPKKDTIEMAE